MQKTQKSSGVLFWFLLAVFIFVLYVISMDRPYCQTLDAAAINSAIQNVLPSARGSQSGSGGQGRYQTPPIYVTDTVVAEFQSPVPRVDSPPDRPGWLPSGNVQPIPRPVSDELEPFGYALFAAQDRLPVDPYAGVVPEDYRLGSGDHLLVKSWGRVDLELELTIDRSGRVLIPKVGPVMVAGMSIADAQGAVRQSLESVYSDFELVVTLARMRTFRVFVLGEVRRPGAYTVGAAATLLDALYRAGGPNERGTLRHVTLTHGSRITTFDLYDFLLSGRRRNDPRLSSGDVIFIDVTGARVAVRGRVKRPGIYELSDHAVLRDVIALAGGLEADAHRDRIMIDRLQERDGRQLLDIDLSDGDSDADWETVVTDGDDISIFSMFEARPNVVWLEGWVKHPGAFERSEGMTVSELLNGGDQLKIGAYLPRADLERTRQEGVGTLLAVDLEDALDGIGDVMLKDGDRLIVYARTAVEPEPTVTIEGEIQRPGEYPLLDAMRVSDLVFRAGNVTRSALMDALEIARNDALGITRILHCDLASVMRRGDLSEDIVLRDGDHVFVRSDPNVVAHRLVQVDGAVRYPGRYALLDDDETFYDVLHRAGGLTPHAFVRGTVFTRDAISEEVERQKLEQILINAQPLQKDSTGRLYRDDLVQFDPNAMTRIVLDVPRILKDQGGEGDLRMRHGDRIFVPFTPSGIQVLGAVASPGTIGYNDRWRMKKYIERAGGLTRSSDKRGIRLVRADGQVLESGGSNLKIELGDAIFVPPKVEKKSDWLKALAQTISVVGGVATTVLVVESLSN